MHFNKELFEAGNENIFVFGSNLAGRHGAGAAKFAKDYCGATLGQGFGLQGNAFAIPTKDEALRVLSLGDIASYVRSFIHFAVANPHLKMYVTAVGTGLAGYSDIEIAPMFADAPPNCILPDKWRVQNGK